MLLNLTLSSQGGFRKRINLPGSYGTYGIASFETSPNNYLVISKTLKTQGNNWITTLDLTKYNAITNTYTVVQFGDTNGFYAGITSFKHIRNYGKKIDNFIYLANFIKTNASFNYTKGVFIKLNFNGDTIWQRKYSSNNEHVFLFQSNKSIDGGFLLSGCTVDSALNICKLLLIKTNANGVELWRKLYNHPSPNYAEGRDIIQDSATKHILITGMRFKGFSNGSQISEKFLMMFDSLGNYLNQIPVSLLLDNISTGIIKDKNNNFYIYGFNVKNTIGFFQPSKPYLIKFKIINSSIVIIYDKEYDVEYEVNAFANAVLDNNDHLQIVGLIDTNGINNIMSNEMVSKFRINTNGDLISKRYYDYRYNLSWNYGVVANGIGLTSDGGIIVPVERLLNSSNNYSPLFFVKYDSLGCDTSAFYCATVGIKENNYQTTNVSIYPQPANQTINLSSPLFANKSAQIQMSNNLGQLCFKQNVKFNNGTLQVPIANLPKGIYILKLIDEDLKTFTQKIIVE